MAVSACRGQSCPAGVNFTRTPAFQRRALRGLGSTPSLQILLPVSPGLAEFRPWALKCRRWRLRTHTGVTLTTLLTSAFKQNDNARLGAQRVQCVGACLAKCMTPAGRSARRGARCLLPPSCYLNKMSIWELENGASKRPLFREQSRILVHLFVEKFLCLFVYEKGQDAAQLWLKPGPQHASPELLQ